MQALDRAVSILDMLSRHENGMSLSEISDVSTLSLGTTHRFLRALADNGLVRQEPASKRYHLGLRILNMATKMLNNNRLVAVGKPYLARTAAEMRKLVYLCQENNDEVVCVDSYTSGNGGNATFYLQIGSVMPFHAAAAAKTIFAHHPMATLQRLIARHAPMHRYTVRTKYLPDEIFEDYAVCRQRGYAVCDEEMEHGVHAFAAPVFNYDRKAVASVVTISIKTGEDNVPGMIQSICACARDISRDMGFIPAGS